MPYIFEKEKLKISGEDDKRVKLTPEDKAKIKKLYETSSISQRELARMFNVSRRSIQFAIDPGKYQTSLEQSKERSKDGRYYDKEKHNEYVKEYRKHKKELYDRGVLI